MTTKLPGIPAIPANLDPQTKAYLKALTEVVLVRTGRIGDPLDRAVTLRELIESGLAESLKNNRFDPNEPTIVDFTSPVPASDLAVPPAPTSLTASAAFQTVLLEWSNGNIQFSNFAFTEIYRHTSNVIGDAVLVGVVAGNRFADQVDSNSTHYYWVRHVSEADVRGPFNATNGVVATTADINAADIADQAVTNAKLAIDAVQGAVIAASAITTTKIQDDAISTAKIAANAVTANEIAANAVTANEIAANSVTASELVTGTITASSGILANASVVSATIADAAVGNAKIANLDAGKINTGQLNANRINVDGATITASGSGALQVNTLSANKITTGTLNGNNVNVTNINANNINSGQISANRIDVNNLVLPTGGGLVNGSTIGSWATNVFAYRFVTSIGTGIGFYTGYVRLVGGTNHVKSVTLFFTTSGTAAPSSSNTIYESSRTDKLAGHVLRFYSTSDSQNIPMAFTNISHTGSVYLWIYAQGDSGPDTLNSVDARFFRLGIS